MTFLRTLLFAVVPLVPVIAEATPTCSASLHSGARTAQFLGARGLVSLDRATLRCLETDGGGRCAKAELLVSARPSALGDADAITLHFASGTTEVLELRPATVLELVDTSSPRTWQRQKAQVTAWPRGTLYERSPGVEQMSPYGSVRIDAIEGDGPTLVVRGTLAICLQTGSLAGPFAATPPAPSRDRLFDEVPKLPVSFEGTLRFIRLDGIVSPPGGGIGLGGLPLRPKG